MFAIGWSIECSQILHQTVVYIFSTFLNFTVLNFIHYQSMLETYTIYHNLKYDCQPKQVDLTAPHQQT
jgi:hypothetical protein